MTRRNPAYYHHDYEIASIFNPARAKDVTIDFALEQVLLQLRSSGYRPRTLNDYETIVTKFAQTMRVHTIREITRDTIYAWLSGMDVSNQTKLTRLKCLKAWLTHCERNGFVRVAFWRNIHVKVDETVKIAATEGEVRLLLSMLDLTKFSPLRDATAIYLMFKTGVRVGTLWQIRESDIDFDEKVLRLGGGILKNHESIYLPFDDQLVTLFRQLMKHNRAIRKYHGTDNDLLFITYRGNAVFTPPSNHLITKRMSAYCREYKIKSITPHGLRRGFAMSLLEKGANINVISRALGHSDLGVTSTYLQLDKRDVATALRGFL
ncbi:site-specific integrase [Paenalkalicoccus suaedae]|uniref:Site-specific integrase n=1 Tax=Paenalkalicoccus suaedae TaxID=2592382 RepID=A0A859FH34_9BACI|nr:site-specific integrase [Paenalkalicoccus suaedae]QKS71964.1 site-specific integrase [Paenalkalicoccus suaedae]